MVYTGRVFDEMSRDEIINDINVAANLIAGKDLKKERKPYSQLASSLYLYIAIK